MAYAYCAICGVDAGQRFSYYSSKWTGKVRFISQNAHWDGDDQVFISGQAFQQQDVDFIVEPSDDPKFGFPREEDPEIDALYVKAYSFYERHPAAIPFHEACFKLFCRCLGFRDAALPASTFYDAVADETPVVREQQSTPGLDREMLYHTLRPLINYQALDLDYGERALSRLHRVFRHWEYRPANEPLFGHPAEIPALAQFYEALPLLADGPTGLHGPALGASLAVSPGVAAHPHHHHDPFSRLPTEMTLLVLAELDLHSVHSLRRASRTAAVVTLTNDFWRVRVARDMPWLYDFPVLGPTDSAAVDWSRAYQHLHTNSVESQDRVEWTRLSNRRRIWEVCEQLRGPYLRNVAQKKSLSTAGRPPIPSLFAFAVEGRIPRVMTPPPAKPGFETATLALFANVSDLEAVRPVLSVHWTDAGELAAVTVSQLGGHEVLPHLTTIGSPAKSARRDEVAIPERDWLRGLGIVTRPSNNECGNAGPIVGLQFFFAEQNPVDTGCCCHGAGDLLVDLLYQDRARQIVGLRADVSTHTGLPLRLRLLLQHEGLLIREDWDDSRLLAVATYSDRRPMSPSPPAPSGPDALRYVWRPPLPPFHLELQAHEGAIAAPTWPTQTHAWEALVFGADEAELGDVVSLAADAGLGGFEVGYTLSSGRPTRAVGPRRSDMKVLEVDGPGGERVCRVFVTCPPCGPERVRFVTNRGRELVVFSSVGNGEEETEEDKGCDSARRPESVKETEHPKQPDNEPVDDSSGWPVSVAENRLRGICCCWVPSEGQQQIHPPPVGSRLGAIAVLSEYLLVSGDESALMGRGPSYNVPVDRAKRQAEIDEAMGLTDDY